MRTKRENDLNKMDGVEATKLAGAYDVIAKVNAENAESLTGTIALGIKNLSRIQSTLTLIVNEDTQNICNGNSQSGKRAFFI